MEKDTELKNHVLEYVKENYVERRDNPLEVLPHVVEPEKFYIDQYNKCKFELERLKNLTDAEAKEEEITRRKQQLDDHEKYIKKEKLEIERLNKLLKKTRNWDCPETLKETKYSIIKNIERDILSNKRHIDLPPCIDEEIDGREYKDQMIERYQGMVDDYRKNVDYEQKRADEINQMLKDLKENLGDW